ncbi:acyl-CoA-binding domain-containing protein 4 isoform X8 [Ailuropoda melanoleuca]|uniref:acyl-CoA-binding domain-containing protein 4 isoform X8 n=1 Tax=Ailuropoda melanoleuca TaxID=9646 RepID=UPI001494A659|nr:acyl-CoA-binding domain-containing protein 4 isoform X8 [Ailuropoda melanoleuca]
MGTENESPEPDCQKQFQAAVSVIQNLPKNGSYRPSYEEMLKFYSYYKQATMGPCLVPRPGFWDPIGRYKWDAWNSLGKMSREEAMSAYITEMKLVAQKVIDTVPLGEVAEDMFAYFEPLYQSPSHLGTQTLRFSVIPWSSWNLSCRFGQSRREPLEESLTPETAPCSLQRKRAACWGPKNWTRGWWGQFGHCKRACGTSRGDCGAWRACPGSPIRGPRPVAGPGPSGSRVPRCSSSSCGPSSSSGSSDSFEPRRGDSQWQPAEVAMNLLSCCALSIPRV